MDFNYAEYTELCGSRKIDGQPFDMTDLNKELSIIVAENLRTLLINSGEYDEHKKIYRSKDFLDWLTGHSIHMDNSQLKKMIEITRSNIQKDGYTKHIPLGVLVAYATKYKVPIEGLLTKNGVMTFIQKNEETNNPIPSSFNTMLDIAFNNNKDSYTYNMNGNDSYTKVLKRFVLIKNYYCYFPKEKAKGDQIDSKHGLQSGKITFLDVEGVCVVKLTTDEQSGFSKNDDFFSSKTYTGVLVISNEVECCYCILKSDAKPADLSFFSFRTRQTQNELLKNWSDCRICEVLTTVSDRPTVHRMLLCREELRIDDLQYVAPHLKMNQSNVTISSKCLSTEDSDFIAFGNYLKYLRKDGRRFPPVENYYTIKEDVIKNSLPDNNVKLLSKLRSLSLDNKFNKISKKVDDNVWELLSSLNYFQN